MQFFVFAVAASIAQLLPRGNFQFYFRMMDYVLGNKNRIIHFILVYIILYILCGLLSRRSKRFWLFKNYRLFRRYLN